MKQSKRTVFVCDDNSDSCELIKFVFELEGYEVVSCDNLEDCLSGALQNDFDAIVLDNRFGQVSSLEACREIRGFNRTVPIIFYSGEARAAEINKALEAGADAYLVKPNDFERLTGTVINFIKRGRS